MSITAPRRFAIEVVESWQQLASEAAAWDDLAEHALEPNVFYESGAVLAAMRHLPIRGKPLFLIVRGEPQAAGGDGAWCGFFPFVRGASYRGVPLPSLALLKHDYCYLRVPLLRADCAGEVLARVLGWLARSRYALVELGEQTGDGAYAELLAASLQGSGQQACLAASYQRALFVPATDAEAYIAHALRSSKRKELRRQERRLAERGELSFERVTAETDVEPAIGEFLALEAAGWKGDAGTAMSCRPGHREFFAELVRSAWRAGRLRMTTLRAGGRPVAMKCSFEAPPGSFAFKIAYAEELAVFSPGVLLELENIRELHEAPRLAWMDSCAVAGHSMIERLWRDTRAIQSWLLPLDVRGRALCAGLAGLQLLKRVAQRGVLAVRALRDRIARKEVRS